MLIVQRNINTETKENRKPIRELLHEAENKCRNVGAPMILSPIMITDNRSSDGQFDGYFFLATS